MCDRSIWGESGLGRTDAAAAGIGEGSRRGSWIERPRMGKSGRRGVTGGPTAVDAGSRSELSSLDVRREAPVILGEGDSCVPPPSERLRVLDMGDGASNLALPESRVPGPAPSIAMSSSMATASSYPVLAIQPDAGLRLSIGGGGALDRKPRRSQGGRGERE